eukprot:gene15072-17841_t
MSTTTETTANIQAKLGELTVKVKATAPAWQPLRAAAVKRGAKLASMPQWSKQRAFLNNGFLCNQTGEFASNRPGKYQQSLGTLDDLPLADQERTVIEDLLSAMLGIEGSIIHVARPADHLEATGAAEALITFTVDASIDASTVLLTQRILPLCAKYTYISDFVDTRSNYEWGLVSHALAEAITELLHEHHNLVVMLETQHRANTLTLQRLWFHVQPIMKQFDVLYAITLAATRSQLYGAQLINLLACSLRDYGADARSRELYTYLQTAAIRPLLGMLDTWLLSGVVNDPHFEFMIEENTALVKEGVGRDYNDSYWDHRYTLRADQIPTFLEKSAAKVLLAGKYLNVMRECGATIAPPPAAARLSDALDERAYIVRIERAYDYASSSLLGLMHQRELIPMLKAIKHYFLLCKGDFFSHFMDITCDELAKPLTSINIVKINSLLQLSLRTSSIADSDAFKDGLECEFLSMRLSDHLLKILHIDDRNIIDQQQQQARGANNMSTMSNNQSNINNTTTNNHNKTRELLGIESLAFNYKVRWPLSLVVSRKAIVKYQIIFRYLFLCKHVERLLNSSWCSSQDSRQGRVCKPGLAPLLRYCHFLRHRMIHFLQNLECYMMLEVLEPNWNKMKKDIKTSKTVDEVIKQQINTSITSKLYNSRSTAISTKITTTNIK